MKQLWVLLGFFCVVASMIAEEATNPKPITTLQKLLDGNERFSSRTPIHRAYERSEMPDACEEENPRILVLSCSDAPLPPEQIFDQASGEIYVIRLPGNVVNPDEFQNILFALSLFEPSLLLVLGHKDCTAFKTISSGTEEEKNRMEPIASYIDEAFYQSSIEKGDPLANAIKENIQQSIRTLFTHPDVSLRVKRNDLFVVGGYFNPDTGKVEIFYQS